MVTVDGMHLARLRLLKVDVEGGEDLVLWGARETIARDRPVILIERLPSSAEPANRKELFDVCGVPTGSPVRSWDADAWLAKLGYAERARFSWDIMLTV